MAERKTKAGGVAADRLKQYVHSIERMLEEKKALARGITDKYQEIRGAGFDVKTVRQIIKMRAMDSAELDEAEHLLDVYKQALDMDHNGGDEVRRAAALFRQNATIDDVASMMDVSRSQAGRLRQACIVMEYIEGDVPTKKPAPRNVGTGVPHDEETGEIHEPPAGEPAALPPEQATDPVRGCDASPQDATPCVDPSVAEPITDTEAAVSRGESRVAPGEPSTPAEAATAGEEPDSSPAKGSDNTADAEREAVVTPSVSAPLRPAAGLSAPIAAISASDEIDTTIPAFLRRARA